MLLEVQLVLQMTNHLLLFIYFKCTKNWKNKEKKERRRSDFIFQFYNYQNSIIYDYS